MLTLNRDVFRSSGLEDSFLSMARRAIGRGDVTIDDNGRVKTWGGMNALARLPFDHNQRSVSIAALIAVKNGYSGEDIDLRSSDFPKTGAQFIADIFRDNGMECFLPVSNAAPKSGNRDALKNARGFADIGL